MSDPNAISRRSMVRAGYYDDPFVRHFVAKLKQRSAVVHRLQFAMAHLHDAFIDAFVTRHDGPVQLVLVGCGDDTSTFRLAQRQGSKGRCVRVFDLERDAVQCRRRATMQPHASMQALIRDAYAERPCTPLGVELLLLSVGDPHTEVLTDVLQRAGFVGALPTAVVLGDHHALVSPNALSIVLQYPCVTALTLAEDVAEMRDGHASIESTSFDLWTYYYTVMSEAERTRVQSLEVFFEHETWLRVARARCVRLYGNTTIFSRDVDDGRSLSGESSSCAGRVDSTVTQLDIGTRASASQGRIARWGHTVCASSEGAVLFGGYSSASAPLNDVHCLSRRTLTWRPLVTGGCPPAGRAYHAAVSLGGMALLVVGGHGTRTSAHLPPRAWLLDCGSSASGGRWLDRVHLPGLARFRLAMDMEQIHDDTDEGSTQWRVVACGGLAADEPGVLHDNVVMLRLRRDENASWQTLDDDWRTLVLGTQQRGRHSHSLTRLSAGTFFMYGGMDASERLLGDPCLLHLGATNSATITDLTAHFDPPLPRVFGHRTTASSDGTRLVILGGVFEENYCDRVALVVDLSTFVWEWCDTETVLLGASPTALYGHATCVLADTRRLLLCGGGDSLLHRCEPVTRVLEVPFGLESVAAAESVVAQPAIVTTGTPATRAIRSVDALTEEEFEHACEHSRTPFVLRGCSLGTAVEEWTPEFLSTVGRGVSVPVHCCEDDQLDFIAKNYALRTLEFDELVRRVFDVSSDARMYLRSVGNDVRKERADMRLTFPALGMTFALPAAMEARVSARHFSTALRVGSQGIRVFTHYDICDNVLCQVRGEKRVTVAAPESAHALSVHGSQSRVVDLKDDCASQLHPRFAQVQRYETTLGPGDILFIPACWFHSTESLTPCVSVNAFFTHLQASDYCPRDLYGSKDLTEATKALDDVERALVRLRQLPQYYARFYASIAAGKCLQELNG